MGWNVTLSAMAYVMGFYSKYGYEHTASCAADRRVVAIDHKSLPPCKRRSDSHTDCYLTCDEGGWGSHCEPNTQFLDHMLELLDAGLMEHPAAACTKTAMDALPDQAARRHVFQAEDCGAKGFVMRKCLHAPPP